LERCVFFRAIVSAKADIQPVFDSPDSGVRRNDEDDVMRQSR
jgi:hypothetical protein